MRKWSVLGLGGAVLVITGVVVWFFVLRETPPEPEPSSGTTHRSICALCARRLVSTELRWENRFDGLPLKKTKERLEPTLLWERVGAAHEKCAHEWFPTGGTAFTRTGHGHLWLQMDGTTVSWLSETEDGIAVLLAYAARVEVDPLVVWRKMVRYASTRDDTYRRPFEETGKAGDTRRLQGNDAVDWLERNMHIIDARLSARREEIDHPIPAGKKIDSSAALTRRRIYAHERDMAFEKILERQPELDAEKLGFIERALIGPKNSASQRGLAGYLDEGQFVRITEDAHSYAVKVTSEGGFETFVVDKKTAEVKRGTWGDPGPVPNPDPGVRK